MWGSLWALPKVESSARTCALLSQINAAGQLQWQFTSGFDLRNSLWLPFTVRTRFIRFPQGTMGPFQLGDNNPFHSLMQLLGMSKVDSSAHICDSPSNLYVVGQLQWWFTCGFNFRHSLWLSFVSTSTLVKVIIIVPMETMGHFESRENPFQTLGEVVGSVQSQEEGARSHLTFKGLCCQSASVTVYLWFWFTA